jgi:WD40 repeat protein
MSAPDHPQADAVDDGIVAKHADFIRLVARFGDRSNEVYEFRKKHSELGDVFRRHDRTNRLRWIRTAAAGGVASLVMMSVILLFAWARSQRATIDSFAWTALVSVAQRGQVVLDKTNDLVVEAVRVSPNDRFVALAQHDFNFGHLNDNHGISVFDTASGGLVGSIALEPSDVIVDVAFSSGSDAVAVLLSERLVVVSVATGGIGEQNVIEANLSLQAWPYRGGINRPQQIAFVPGTREIVYISRAGIAHQSLSDHELLGLIVDKELPASLAVSPTGMDLAYATTRGQVALTRLADHRTLWKSDYADVSAFRPSEYLVYSRDGGTICHVKTSGDIDVWNAEDGKRLYVVSGGKDVVDCTVDPIAGLIRGCDDRGRVVLWNVRQPNLANAVRIRDRIFPVSLSKDGNRLFAVSEGPGVDFVTFDIRWPVSADSVGSQAFGAR